MEQNANVEKKSGKKRKVLGKGTTAVVQLYLGKVADQACGVVDGQELQEKQADEFFKLHP